MKLIATSLHLLLQVVQFTSPTPLSVPKNPIASNTIGFLKAGICHYGSVFFKGELYPADTCVRVTCYGLQRQMTIETCLSSQEFKGLCKRKAIQREKTGQFPHCCDLYTCRDQGISPDAAAFPMERILPDEVTPSIIIHVGNTYPDTETDIFIGEIKTYTADQDPDNEIHETMASGYWKAKRVYITSACYSEMCSYNDQNFKFVRYLLGSECKEVKFSDKKDYVIVQSCPILDTTKHECSMIENGINTDGYPGCCPVYMCPPDGYQKKLAHLDNFHVEVRNGNCVYKGESFQHSMNTSTKCFDVTCDVEKQSVTGQTCLDKEQLGWLGCVVVSGKDKHSSGLPPNCCPDVLCPDIRVDNGTFERTTDKASRVTNDVCTYKGRHFRRTISVSSVCQQWTCIPKSEQVEVLSCQETMGPLGEYCKWEFQDTSAPFPHCCAKKVCRYPYSTRYPGLKLPPSPLTGTPYP